MHITFFVFDINWKLNAITRIIAPDSNNRTNKLISEKKE